MTLFQEGFGFAEFDDRRDAEDVVKVVKQNTLFWSYYVPILMLTLMKSRPDTQIAFTFRTWTAKTSMEEESALSSREAVEVVAAGEILETGTGVSAAGG